MIQLGCPGLSRDEPAGVEVRSCSNVRFGYGAEGLNRTDAGEGGGGRSHLWNHEVRKHASVRTTPLGGDEHGGVLMGMPRVPDPNCGRCGGSGYIEFPDQPGGGIGGGPRVEPCPCERYPSAGAGAGGGGGGGGSGGGCLSRILGNVILGVFLMGLLVIGVIGVGIYQTFVSNRPGILGEDGGESTWSGRYVCDDGAMTVQADLTVEPGGPDAHRALRARFAYRDSDAGGESEPLHTSSARGTLVDRQVNLIGEELAGAPPFQIAAVSGTVSEEADLLLGTVVAQTCSSFGLVPE